LHSPDGKKLSGADAANSVAPLVMQVVEPVEKGKMHVVMSDFIDL